MSQFYKMDPAAWDFGTSNLSLEEEAAYLRIVNAIHKHDAPVPNNDRVLAGLFRSSTRKARALLDALLAAGKVVIEDGAIWNDRARSDLVRRGFTSISRAESGAKGGRTRAENAANALKDNDAGQAIASTRIEKNREEKKEVGGGVARDREDGLIWGILHALGFDRGQVIPKYWIAPDTALIVNRWKLDLGLNDEEIIQVATANTAQHGQPANGPKTLNRAMADFAAAKHAAPLQPTISHKPANGGRHELTANQKFGTAISALADDLSAGRVRIRSDDRDPFAPRSGLDS